LIIVVALGIEEFASKPGLSGKHAENLVDQTLLKELEGESFFARLYSNRKKTANELTLTALS
jgi:hypothetical protein